MAKTRQNIIVAPLAAVSFPGNPPGGDSGILTVNTTGGVNRLVLIFPDGTTKEAVLDSSSKLAFI